MTHGGRWPSLAEMRALRKLHEEEQLSRAYADLDRYYDERDATRANWERYVDHLRAINPDLNDDELRDLPGWVDLDDALDGPDRFFRPTENQIAQAGRQRRARHTAWRERLA